ncbi:MAG: DUF2442 domain-containing protein [Rhizomicrobium sp.]
MGGVSEGERQGVSKARVKDVQVTDDALVVLLRDGRKVSAPLAWFPRLMTAPADQRNVWELSAAGHGIHWPAIDEDLSVEGLLQGWPAPSA